MGKKNSHSGVSKLGTGPGVRVMRGKTYIDGVQDALKAAKSIKGSYCLCGHFDICSGDCKPNVGDIIKAIEKLLE